jgi:2-polyprenyl-3-methyl-5-hydroxy-6-metoxy-1,4-benzoquinol methylase
MNGAAGSAGETPAPTPCLFCGDATRARFLFARARPVFRCECGLVYTPPPTVAEAARGYTEAYYHGQVYPNYVGDRRAIRRNAARVLGELERAVSGRRLLDVGCAHGFYLEAARERGWSVRGIEVSEHASSYARRELGLDVETGSIAAPPAGLGIFDGVMMWDVIEHLERPDLALARVREHMDPRGILMLSTGDYRSVLQRLVGRRWRIFGDPTHIFFFDARTVTRLLTDAGFEVLSLRRRGKHVSLATALNQSPLPGATRIIQWLERARSQPGLYVNLWDMMQVVARPRCP